MGSMESCASWLAIAPRRSFIRAPPPLLLAHSVTCGRRFCCLLSVPFRPSGCPTLNGPSAAHSWPIQSPILPPDGHCADTFSGTSQPDLRSPCVLLHPLQDHAQNCTSNTLAKAPHTSTVLALFSGQFTTQWAEAVLVGHGGGPGWARWKAVCLGSR